MTSTVLRLLPADVARAAIELIGAIASAAGLVGVLAAPALIGRCRTELMTITADHSQNGAVPAVVVKPMAWMTTQP